MNMPRNCIMLCIIRCKWKVECHFYFWESLVLKQLFMVTFFHYYGWISLKLSKFGSGCVSWSLDVEKSRIVSRLRTTKELDQILFWNNWRLYSLTFFYKSADIVDSQIPVVVRSSTKSDAISMLGVFSSVSDSKS